MIATPDLIESLAANVQPVRRLLPPGIRAVRWLLLAALILTLLTISQGVRSDLMQKLVDFEFTGRLAGALATAVLAAISAFVLSLPDRTRLWLLLPLPGLVLWLSTMGHQCLTHWVSFDASGMQAGEAARCFATLVLTSLPLSLAMLLMLRFAAPLRPTAAILAGSLAVGAVTASAMSLFHIVDASIMILMWNLGTAILFIALAGIFGRKMLSWVAPQSPLHRA